MGFWSSLGSSAMSAASSMSLHDLTGGWSDYSSRKASAKYEAELSKGLMDYQYDLNRRSLLESPSAYKAGLIAGGYNPMLAISNGVPASSVGLGSGGRMPASDGSSKPFDGLARRVKETADTELENLEATGDSIRAHIDFDRASSAADVKLKEAEAVEALSRARKTTLEGDSIDPVARKFFESHPGETTKEFYSWVKTLDDIESMFKGNGKGSSAKEVKSVEDRSREIEKKFRENSKPHRRGVHKAFRDSKRDLDWSIFRTTYGY